MIAYNHYIKFIPELEKSNKMEGSFTDVVTVEELSFPDLDEKLLFMMTFYNNQGRDLWLYTDREVSRTVEGQLWAFEVKDVMTFFWYSGSWRLGYIKHKNYTDDLLKYWTLHVILPIFFTIEEKYDFLHAGAVEVEGKPILFIAPSMGGKSTMTDFFMKKGHIVISDDKVATFEHNNHVFAVPSHPHHRPYRKMEDLGIFINSFSTKIKPIQSIYKLEKIAANSEASIAELIGVEKFIALRYSSEMNVFFQKSKRFEYLVEVSKRVPVFRVSVPWDIERIQEVYELIYKHSQELK